MSYEDFFLLSAIFLLSVRCNSKSSNTNFFNWRLDNLYAQKIEGTSKTLYKFDAWGGIDSNARGFLILNSNEKFVVDINNTLPILYLSEIPLNNKILGINHECYDSCGELYKSAKPILNPIKIDKFVKGDFEIENKIYQYKGFSERTKGLGRYVFENFKETKDSIYFYNLNDVESMDPDYLDFLKIKKTEVYLDLNDRSEIIKISLNDLEINDKTGEIVKFRDYFLTPKNKILSNQFSEYGIFRQINFKK